MSSVNLAFLSPDLSTLLPIKVTILTIKSRFKYPPLCLIWWMNSFRISPDLTYLASLYTGGEIQLKNVFKFFSVMVLSLVHLIPLSFDLNLTCNQLNHWLSNMVWHCYWCEQNFINHLCPQRHMWRLTQKYCKFHLAFWKVRANTKVKFSLWGGWGVLVQNYYKIDIHFVLQ